MSVIDKNLMQTSQTDLTFSRKFLLSEEEKLPLNRGVGTENVALSICPP